MAKIRLSKTEVQLRIQELLSQGYIMVSYGNTPRVVKAVLSKRIGKKDNIITITYTANGWVTIA